MRTVCVDQSMLRSTELEMLIKDPEVRFIVPDAAIMEMCKSTEWEGTIRNSLKLLSEVPERVFVTIGNGECLKTELTLGRALALGDLISTKATDWIRELLGEVRDKKRGEMFEAMAAAVHDANAKARAGHLDHSTNRESLLELVPTLRSGYSEEFQKRLRAKRVGEAEFVATVSRVATQVVDDVTCLPIFGRTET